MHYGKKVDQCYCVWIRRGKSEGDEEQLKEVEAEHKKERESEVVGRRIAMNCMENFAERYRIVVCQRSGSSADDDE